MSVSADLYEDAKRDLSDLGLDKYASAKCYNLSNYKSQDALKQEEGVMFTTYSTLISKNRLDQLLQWCGVSFDGLIMLDECHRCKSIELDGDGNAKKGSSKSGTYQQLPTLLRLYQSVHLTQPSTFDYHHTQLKSWLNFRTNCLVRVLFTAARRLFLSPRI